MLAWVVLAICILLAFVLAGKWLTTADPKTIIKVVSRLLLGLAVVAIVFLAVTGRLAFAIPLLVAGFWWIVRNGIKNLLFSSARKAFSNAAGRSSHGRSNNQSDIKTDYLRMSLNHESGEISGEVLKGRFAGAMLVELEFEEVLELLDECNSKDQRSATLLEGYLDRTAGPDWRDKAGANQTGNNSSSRGSGGSMTREEALEILGLTGAPDAGAIKQAHHRLMQQAHPDKGGSTWMATKINEARDLLLNT